MFRNGFVFRLIGVVLLVGLVAAGGFMAFRAGEARGISQAPAVATAISQATENGQGVSLPPMMYGHGYAYGYGPGYPMMYGRPFGFFPGGICLSILFLFLFLGAMRMIFFRRMVHGGHMHGSWGRHGGDGVPPMFNEWHKRAHAEKPGEEQSSGVKA
jgi:hypothetical protein